MKIRQQLTTVLIVCNLVIAAAGGYIGWYLDSKELPRSEIAVVLLMVALITFTSAMGGGAAMLRKGD